MTSNGDPPSSQHLRDTKIPTLVFPTSDEASRHVALMIESLIRQNNSAGRPTVLGLATGSTPVGLYRELIRLHKEAGLDFSRVVTFNLDEYYPMAPDDAHSYRRWMHETFFDHVNIPPENIHIPDGTHRRRRTSRTTAPATSRRSAGRAASTCRSSASAAPGTSASTSRARRATAARALVTLDPVTRRDAAGDFFGEENVPHQALTMGVGTILEARKIVIMAFGEHKAADRPARPSRSEIDRRRHRQLPAEAPRRDVPARRGRRRRADADRAGRGWSGRSTGRRR